VLKLRPCQPGLPGIGAQLTLENWGEEHWLPPAGELMLGVNRTAVAGKPTQFEFLRITHIDEVPTYIARPNGAAGTSFKRSAGGPNWIRFSNLDHDFPQPIEYHRDGDMLKASFAGPGQDGATMTIPFEFQTCSG